MPWHLFAFPPYVLSAAGQPVCGLRLLLVSVHACLGCSTAQVLNRVHACVLLMSLPLVQVWHHWVCVRLLQFSTIHFPLTAGTRAEAIFLDSSARVADELFAPFPSHFSARSWTFRN